MGQQMVFSFITAPDTLIFLLCDPDKLCVMTENGVVNQGTDVVNRRVEYDRQQDQHQCLPYRQIGFHMTAFVPAHLALEHPPVQQVYQHA